MRRFWIGKWGLLSAGIVLLMVAAGCGRRAAPSPTAAPTPDPSTAVVAVRSVDVVQSDNPRQVLLIVQAALPNTCLRVGEAAVERQGRVFTVNLAAEIAAGQPCQNISISQDRIVRLPADELPPGSYLALVNGRLANFQILQNASPGGQSGQDQPAPTATADTAPPPTPTPALEPTPSPTPTAIPEPEVAPSPTPTTAPLVLPSGQDTAGCTSKAAFYGTLTVPDGTPFEPGARFTKTWLVMNVGSCTWGPGYQLIFAGGNPLGAPESLPLPPARPRQVVQVSVEMTAPDAPQAYDSLWAFQTPEGYRFGLGNPPVTPLSAKIVVATRPAGVASDLDCGALRLRDLEQQVLEQINATRAGYNLYPLELNEEISEVALQHSLEMACYDRTSHHGRDGMLYNVRLQRAGIQFETSNEILYAGNGGPSGAITWWMGSSIHKPIVLTTRYTQIGIGYVYYDRNPYKQRITVDFIRP